MKNEYVNLNKGIIYNLLKEFFYIILIFYVFKYLIELPAIDHITLDPKEHRDIHRLVDSMLHCMLEYCTTIHITKIDLRYNNMVFKKEGPKVLGFCTAKKWFIGAV